MSNYEKYGSITISPTLINDKEEVHELHKQKGDGVTSWNDLTDKPFYEEEVCLVEKQVVDVSEKMPGDGYGVTIQTPVDLYEYVNKNVTFIFDGKEYPCPVQGTVNNYRIGNTKLYKIVGGAPSSAIQDGDDTGEPFCMFSYTGTIWLYCYNKGIHTIEIKVKVPKTLDSKFLPKAEGVADLTEAPTAENFNALLASLRAAGYLSE